MENISEAPVFYIDAEFEKLKQKWKIIEFLEKEGVNQNFLINLEDLSLSKDDYPISKFLSLFRKNESNI